MTILFLKNMILKMKQVYSLILVRIIVFTNCYVLTFFTDLVDKLNDTNTNITSLPEISNYMTTHFVIISGASVAGCVIILSFGIYNLFILKQLVLPIKFNKLKKCT